MILSTCLGCGDTTSDSASGTSSTTGTQAGCDRAYLGDPLAPASIEIKWLDGGLSLHDLDEDGAIELVDPPQGGRVLYVGFQVRNVSPCEVEARATLTDPHNGQTREEVRVLDLDAVDPGSGGTIAGDAATAVHIPACTGDWASADIYDQTFDLKVRITDADGKIGELSAKASPMCAFDVDACRCACDQDEAGAGGCGQ